MIDDYQKFIIVSVHSDVIAQTIFGETISKDDYIANT